MRFLVVVAGCVLPFAVAAAEPAASTPRAGFNPDISLILSGQYGYFSNDPDAYTLPGIMRGPETAPGPRGLSLAESELIISANVDDLFYGQLTAAITPEHEVELEEAYVQTLGLPGGTTLRAGRFLSAIGYLNSQHPHSQDFADVPLPYRALLGNKYGDDGVRLSWVAPLDLYVQLGGEMLRGENFPAAGAARAGRGAWTAYAQFGGDVGASHAWRAGLSYLRARAVDRESGDIENAPDAFSGDSRIAIADFVWKWSPNGNQKERNFKLQGEYLWRDESGSFTADLNSVNAPALTDAFTATQSGWYLQAVWQFMPHWRIGLRHDQLRTHALDAGANGAVFAGTEYTPHRTSAMLDWSRSEFSRVRLQVTRDRSAPDAGSEVILQYIMSLGAHGAHAF